MTALLWSHPAKMLYSWQSILYLQPGDGLGGSSSVGILQRAIQLVLHFDQYLAEFIARYGVWTLVILFVIIFMETGLVVTPFLPGDSLIFAAGAFAAQGAFSPVVVFVLLSIAAVLGDTVNYWIGHKIGAKAYSGE